MRKKLLVIAWFWVLTLPTFSLSESALLTLRLTGEVDQVGTRSSTYSTIKSPKLKFNTTEVKMIQVSLNLLGYKAGKVDGIIGAVTKGAIREFQNVENIKSTGNLDGQTCLKLARQIKEKFPNDKKANEIHDHLLRLYLNIQPE